MCKTIEGALNISIYILFKTIEYDQSIVLVAPLLINGAARLKRVSQFSSIWFYSINSWIIVAAYQEETDCG